jgi:signal transduction histidine kinase/CheY-like chemotaxis protein
LNWAASIALLSAGISAAVAALSWLFSRAPGWRDQRHFALAALAGATWSALDLPTASPVFSEGWVLGCSRLQWLFAALHSVGWLWYSSARTGTSRPTLDRFLAWVAAVLGAVGALTGLFLDGTVRVHAFPPLGALYRTATTTTAGDLAYAAVILLLLVPVARFAGAWRRGDRTAGVQVIALLLLLAMALNDIVVVSGLYTGPYLVDVGFLLPTAAVGVVLTSRFVEAARAHEALRHGLETQVAERTAQLGAAQEALLRSEKLAALGQFAAGVAHEVNNPAAVVAANLDFIAAMERDLSPKSRDAVRESVTAVQRIVAIVRQLLDAGRLAGSKEPSSAVSPKALGDAAISVARARFGKRVWLGNLVPEELWVLGQEGVLAQVLVNLVVNAVQAISDRRSDGRVLIRGESVGANVRIVVEDNGSGMEPDVLRRVFEPFFTTKPFGSGTGLGLAVSRGLVIGLGGDLRLESTPGVGTRAIVELAAADRPAPTPLPQSTEVVGPRLRVLLVDDEPAVLSSLQRLLELRYAVTVAPGVDEGLALLAGGPFDVVLCDVMMPAGGGERFYRTLLGRDPAQARRVVFFTGGTVTESARRFLLAQQQPVLYKPLDLEKLARVAEQVVAPTTAVPAGSTTH